MAWRWAVCWEALMVAGDTKAPNYSSSRLCNIFKSGRMRSWASGRMWSRAAWNTLTQGCCCWMYGSGAGDYLNGLCYVQFLILARFICPHFFNWAPPPSTLLSINPNVKLHLFWLSACTHNARLAGQQRTTPLPFANYCTCIYLCLLQYKRHNASLLMLIVQGGWFIVVCILMCWVSM
jgi:hypothetical protein